MQPGSTGDASDSALQGLVQHPQGGGLAPTTAGLLGLAEDGLECRRFEVAGVGIELRQDLRGSNALRPLDDDRATACGGGRDDGEAPPHILASEDLSRVGLVVWQAGFVLADLLLRRPPFATWHGTRVLDLGCGTGLVGILLALAGAEATLTDRPHICQLAELNSKANLEPGRHRARVVPYTWGQGDAAAVLLPPPAVVPAATAAPPALAAAPPSQPAEREPAAGAAPPAAPAESAARTSRQLPGAESRALPGQSFDVITAADVVYQPELYADLAATLRALAAPHTLIFLAFKRRGLREDSLLQLLEGHGFAVAEVPQHQLAEEYREAGCYRVVRACRID